MPKESAKVKSQNSRGTKKTIKPVQKEESNVPVSVKSSKKASGGLTIDVFDMTGKVIEAMTLPAKFFGEKENKHLLAQAVRVYLANQRRGTVSTKTRGEVQGSTRKIYKQKGTGRARHGAIRAPIFVKGGIAFGPKPRDFSLKLPQKMRQKALAVALSTKLTEKAIKIVKDLEKIEPKTKKMVDVLQKLEISSKKTNVLVVLPKENSETIKKAARNIEGVHLLPVNQLTTYHVLNHANVLFVQSSLEALS